jgi:hypothetical protein
VLSRFDPEHIYRPIRSFAPRLPTGIVGYDANLKNASAGVFTVTNTDPPGSRLLAFTSLDLPFPTNTEARRQNTFEFSTILLGELLLHILGIRGGGLELEGDSVSSLRWAERDWTSSVLARRANIAHTLLATLDYLTIEKTTHILGVDNIVWDSLTREKSAVDVGPAHTPSSPDYRPL